MTSDSTTLLAVVLERRFGVRWLQRWQKLPDEETRWLALYLADEVSRGRNLGRGEAATSAIMAARAQLPPAKRTDRTAFSLLGTLQTAGLWPLPDGARTAEPQEMPHDQSPAGPEFAT